jgi:endonuclease YncB( thermonuclease family)
VERYAACAAALNSRLVLGRVVRRASDLEQRDAYGRVLAYVHADGRMVNAMLVRAGVAEAFPFLPNTRHRAFFDRLQADAMRARRGQWGPAEGGPPWGTVAVRRAGAAQAPARCTIAA